MNSKTSLLEASVDTGLLKKRLDFVSSDQSDPMFARNCSDDDVAMISCERPSEFLTSM